MRGHVFAHLARPNPEALRSQLFVQLGVNQVDLSEVGLGRVGGHARTVLHGGARVGIASYAQARE